MAVQKSKKNKVTIHDKIGTRSLDIKAMEKWLWDAACSIRGHSDAPKFKDFILPLVFFKRLSDVFDDEIQQKIEEFGDKEIALEIIEADHLDALKNGRRGIVRFFIPQGYNWPALRSPKSSPHFEGKSSLGEFVTDAMREVGRLNPELKDVLTKDFNETQSGQRAIDDERLGNLIESLSKYRLGLDDCEPDFLGRAYEYLLRKFAEGQGQSAGEFYTPKEVGWLMAKLLDPQPRTTVYDPTCGSGGLLIKARMVYEEHHPKEKAKAPRLFGQESTAATFAIAKMNMFLHDYAESHVAIGDTLKNPKFSAEGAGLTQFDYVVANPMWNQTGYDETFYQSDKWDRFAYGIPSDKGDWGWLQHILASLKNTGRAAVVLDTGAVSRGSGSKNRDRERDIRKAFVDNDLIEGVVLLPENIFYNTPAQGIIVLLNRKKPKERKNQIILINGSNLFYKEKPKNVLNEVGINKVCEAFHNWKSVDKLSRVVALKEITTSDYNLSPSQFVDINDKATHRTLEIIMGELQAAKSAREKADKEVANLLKKLKL